MRRWVSEVAQKCALYPGKAVGDSFGVTGWCRDTHDDESRDEDSRIENVWSEVGKSPLFSTAEAGGLPGRREERAREGFLLALTNVETAKPPSRFAQLE